MIKIWLSHIMEYKIIYSILFVISILGSIDDKIIKKEFNQDFYIILSLLNDIGINALLTLSLSGILFILSNAIARIVIEKVPTIIKKSAQQGDAPETGSSE